MEIQPDRVIALNHSHGTEIFVQNSDRVLERKLALMASISRIQCHALGSNFDYLYLVIQLAMGESV